jgi:hypothetical protein
MKRVPVEERFVAKIKYVADCWLWTSTLTPRGYPCFWFEGKQWRAHRVAYVLFVGPIPGDLPLDHLCRNRSCVNPSHLEPVTIRENVLRGIGLSAANARKTHCKRGHEFTTDNTYMQDGTRQCRACRAFRDRRYKDARRRQAA